MNKINSSFDSAKSSPIDTNGDNFDNNYQQNDQPFNNISLHPLKWPSNLSKSKGPTDASSASSTSSLSSSSSTSSYSPINCGTMPSKTLGPIRNSLSHLTRLDDFNVIKLSQGFFSEVFKVTHKSTRKVMVLKMNKQAANRGNALKEIELLNKLNHPNIVAFMGTVVHEGQLHPLLEYLNGNTLEKLIRKFYHPSVLKHLSAIESSPSNKLKLDENLIDPWIDQEHSQDKQTTRLFTKLAKDIAQGMSYLHGREYIHRDLTSKNILLRRSVDALTSTLDPQELTAVIADFGFAANKPNLGDPKLPTAGTPYWLSPECLRGLWYNHKCDIFSFGVICCELNWRIPADPDFLPRDNLFNILFHKLSIAWNKTTLARIAQLACNASPSSRPEFFEIISLFNSMESDDTVDGSLKKGEDVNQTCYVIQQAEVGDVFDQHLIRRRNSMFTNISERNSASSWFLSTPLISTATNGEGKYKS